VVEVDGEAGPVTVAEACADVLSEAVSVTLNVGVEELLRLEDVTALELREMQLEAEREAPETEGRREPDCVELCEVEAVSAEEGVAHADAVFEGDPHVVELGEGDGSAEDEVL
jgi:hypothetical protein